MDQIDSADVQELSLWRSQRAKEALKASVLDEEAAAKFSTAAALAQQQKAKRGAAGTATTPAAEPLLVGNSCGLGCSVVCCGAAAAGEPLSRHVAAQSARPR